MRLESRSSSLETRASVLLLSLKILQALASNLTVLFIQGWVEGHLVIDSNLPLPRKLKSSAGCFGLLTPNAGRPIFGIAASIRSCVRGGVNINRSTRTCELHVVATDTLVSRGGAPTENSCDEQKTPCSAPVDTRQHHGRSTTLPSFSSRS